VFQTMRPTDHSLPLRREWFFFEAFSPRPPGIFAFRDSSHRCSSRQRQAGRAIAAPDVSPPGVATSATSARVVRSWRRNWLRKSGCLVFTEYFAATHHRLRAPVAKMRDAIRDGHPMRPSCYARARPDSKPGTSLFSATCVVSMDAVSSTGEGLGSVRRGTGPDGPVPLVQYMRYVPICAGKVFRCVSTVVTALAVAREAKSCGGSHGNGSKPSFCARARAEL